MKSFLILINYIRTKGISLDMIKRKMVWGGYPSVSVCGELHGDPLYLVSNVHVRYGIHLFGLWCLSHL